MPKAIRNAFKHVRQFHPEITMLVLDKHGRWHFMDEDGKSPKFNKKIDVSILQDAVDTVSDLPAFFNYPKEIEITGPDDIEIGCFYRNKSHYNSLYLAVAKERNSQKANMVIVKGNPNTGTVCAFIPDDETNQVYWNNFYKVENPFGES